MNSRLTTWAATAHNSTGTVTVTVMAQPIQAGFKERNRHHLLIVYYDECTVPGMYGKHINDLHNHVCTPRHLRPTFLILILGKSK